MKATPKSNEFVNQIRYLVEIGLGDKREIERGEWLELCGDGYAFGVAIDYFQPYGADHQFFYKAPGLVEFIDGRPYKRYERYIKEIMEDNGLF